MFYGIKEMCVLLQGNVFLDAETCSNRINKLSRISSSVVCRIRGNEEVMLFEVRLEALCKKKGGSVG